MQGLARFGCQLLALLAATGCRFNYELLDALGDDGDPQTFSPAPRVEGGVGSSGAGGASSQDPIDASPAVATPADASGPGNPPTTGSGPPPTVRDAASNASVEAGVGTGSTADAGRTDAGVDRLDAGIDRDAGADASSDPPELDLCANGTELWYSLNPDGSDLRRADGALLPDDSFFQLLLEPCDNRQAITDVVYEFNGGQGSIQPNSPLLSVFGNETGSNQPAFMTTAFFPSGTHAFEATIERSGLPDESIRANVTIENRNGRVVFGSRPDRRDFASLDGATVSGSIFVTLSPRATPSGALTAPIYLDDPGRTNPLRTETAYPVDIEGGTLTEATLFDTRSLTNGLHVIEFVYRVNGSTFQNDAQFRVDN